MFAVGVVAGERENHDPGLAGLVVENLGIAVFGGGRDEQRVALIQLEGFAGICAVSETLSDLFFVLGLVMF